MTLHIEPEPDIPIKTTPIQHELDDLQDRTEAAAETVNFLSEYGLQVDINNEAKDTASALTTACRRSEENIVSGNDKTCGTDDPRRDRIGK